MENERKRRRQVRQRQKPCKKKSFYYIKLSTHNIICEVPASHKQVLRWCQKPLAARLSGFKYSEWFPELSGLKITAPAFYFNSIKKFSHLFLQNLNQFRLHIRIHVRNVKAANSFFHVKLRKANAYLLSLPIFHHKNNICPLNLLFSYWIQVQQSSGFSFKPIFEKLFRCPAPVDVLAADKQCLHKTVSKCLTT